MSVDGLQICASTCSRVKNTAHTQKGKKFKLHERKYTKNTKQYAQAHIHARTYFHFIYRLRMQPAQRPPHKSALNATNTSVRLCVCLFAWLAIWNGEGHPLRGFITHSLHACNSWRKNNINNATQHTHTCML